MCQIEGVIAKMSACDVRSIRVPANACASFVTLLTSGAGAESIALPKLNAPGPTLGLWLTTIVVVARLSADHARCVARRLISKCITKTTQCRFVLFGFVKDTILRFTGVNVHSRKLVMFVNKSISLRSANLTTVSWCLMVSHLVDGETGQKVSRLMAYYVKPMRLTLTLDTFGRSVSRYA